MIKKFKHLTGLIACLSIMSMMLAACGADATATTAPAVATTAPTMAATMAPTMEATMAPTMAATMAATEAATMAPTMAATMAATTAATAAATDTTVAAAQPTNTLVPGATVAAATGTSVVTGGVTGSAAAPTLPASCSNVTIDWWTGFTGPDGPIMQSLVDAFNQANPNIKVTMTTQADIATALGTAQASHTLPDITQINEDVVATRAFQGIIRPMDDIITSMGIQSGDFPKVAWGAGSIAGKQYAVPLSFVAMTMYYNNDLLKTAGMTAAPANQADFEKAAAAMTANGNNGFMITSGFPAQQIFQQLLHQYGGTEFAADGNSATWNSDAGVQALTWMVNAQKNYSQPALPVDADVNGFKTGAVGMIWNGSWQLPNLTGTGVGFAGMAAAPPQIGPSPATWAGGALLAVTTARKAGEDACKDAAEAMFYRYLIDHSADWAKAGNIPAYSQARNSDEFKSNPLAPLTEAVNNPVFPPPIPGVGDAFSPLGDAIAAVMLGNQTDIKKALDDSATKSDQILAQNKAKYGTTPPNQ